jgi:hypothetical protein
MFAHGLYVAGSREDATFSGGVKGIDRPELPARSQGRADMDQYILLIANAPGAAAAHFGADTASPGPPFGSSAMRVHLQPFLEGGAGDGILGLLAGALLK